MSEYQHYIRVDANSIVIYGFTTGFEQPQPGDILLPNEDGRHFRIELRNERGQFRYKYVGGVMVQRTQTELDAEWAARPPEPETDAEKIARLESEKVALEATVGQLNADFVGFIDFYFTQNPDQA